MVDQLLADEQSVDNLFDQTLWAAGDHLGSVRDLVDDSGTLVKHRNWDSIGNLLTDTAPTVTILFGWTGRQHDPATDLQQNHHRWYDSLTGKWLSEDPIGFAAGDGNLGRYVGNSSVNLTDPAGLDSIGHHYVPYQVLKDLLDRGLIDSDSYFAGMGFYTGELSEEGKKYNKWGPEHAQYNADVAEVFEEYFGNGKQLRGKAGAAELLATMKAIRDGKAPNGVEGGEASERIQEFNSKFTDRTKAGVVAYCEDIDTAIDRGIAHDVDRKGMQLAKIDSLIKDAREANNPERLTKLQIQWAEAEKAYQTAKSHPRLAAARSTTRLANKADGIRGATLTADKTRAKVAEMDRLGIGSSNRIKKVSPGKRSAILRSARVARVVTGLSLVAGAASFASNVQAKGMVGATTQLGIDALPVLPWVQLASEAATGREWIPDLTESATPEEVEYMFAKAMLFGQTLEIQKELDQLRAEADRKVTIQEWHGRRCVIRKFDAINPGLRSQIRVLERELSRLSNLSR